MTTEATTTKKNAEASRRANQVVDFRDVLTERRIPSPLKDKLTVEYMRSGIY